jgi:hypothetical protein
MGSNTPQKPGREVPRTLAAILDPSNVWLFGLEIGDWLVMLTGILIAGLLIGSVLP